MTREHDPVISDPRQLEAAAGTRYVVMRPTERLTQAFLQVQQAVRLLPGADGLSYPTAHMTMKACGQGDDEELVAAARSWSLRTPPLEVTFEAITAFPDHDVLAIQVARTRELADAMADLRQDCAHIPAGQEDAIPVDEWVFHTSLAYAAWMPEERWRALLHDVEDLALDRATDHLNVVDVLAFDGGPERLLARFELLGSR